MSFEIILLLFIDAFLHSNYFMYSENKAVSEKADDFVTLDTFKLHKTRYSEVFAEMVTNKEQLYPGLKGNCYFERLTVQKTKNYLSFG